MATLIRTHLRLVVAFAAIYLIWSTTYLGISLAIRTLPPFISGAMRFLLAAVLLYGWLRFKTSTPMKGVSLGKAIITGVLLSGIGNGFVIFAQQGIPSGIAALVVAAVPVFVVMIDWAFFSRRAPTASALLGLLIALIGVTIIVLHTHSLTGAVRPLHTLALISAVIGWSFGTLIQKSAARADTVFSFTCAQMFFGGLFQLLMSFIDGEWARLDIDAVSFASLAAVAYLVVFGSLIALNCYLWLLTRVPAQKVTTYALVNPVIALLLGAVVLGEQITSVTVIAAVLVLIGIALVLFGNLLPTSKLTFTRRASACRGS
jgi:drug/metabolite transporter (DMT)-like permease